MPPLPPCRAQEVWDQVCLHLRGPGSRSGSAVQFSIYGPCATAFLSLPAAACRCLPLRLCNSFPVSAFVQQLSCLCQPLPARCVSTVLIAWIFLPAVWPTRRCCGSVFRHGFTAFHRGTAVATAGCLSCIRLVHLVLSRDTAKYLVLITKNDVMTALVSLVDPRQIACIAAW